MTLEEVLFSAGVRTHTGLSVPRRGYRFRRALWLSAVQRSYEKEVEPRVNGTTRAQSPFQARLQPQHVGIETETTL